MFHVKRGGGLLWILKLLQKKELLERERVMLYQNGKFKIEVK